MIDRGHDLAITKQAAALNIGSRLLPAPPGITSRRRAHADHGKGTWRDNVFVK
jgi:hypothetical protein